MRGDECNLCAECEGRVLSWKLKTIFGMQSVDADPMAIN